MRRSPAEALRRAGRRIPLSLYIGTIAVITTLLAAALLVDAHGNGVAGVVLVTLGTPPRWPPASSR